MSHEDLGLDVGREFEGAELGDRRRVRRLAKLGRDLAAEPSASFPAASGDDAALEGTYRFLNNPAVTPEGILAGHFRLTAERAAEHEVVLAVHDTSVFKFGGEVRRAGLGRLHNHTQGFLGHVTLAVTQDRMPLGVIAVEALTRSAEPKRSKELAPRDRLKQPDNESRRWLRGVRTAEARLGPHAPVIHVMDREADAYGLIAEMYSHSTRFVVRSSHDRRLDGPYDRISEAVEDATFVSERQVMLSRRGTAGRQPRARKTHPARTERVANLHISTTAVVLRRGRDFADAPCETVPVNVVHVREIDTNEDEPPVVWTLLTTEPVDTVADVDRIVDAYRARWLIEEYFKALKTGCAMEKRQLESKHALLNALAVFVPIAWRLLRLRTACRLDESMPATVALTTTQVDVLVATSNNLPSAPTLREALVAIAQLGGHIKNNGEPGWLVLGRGYDKLLTMEVAWIAAMEALAPMRAAALPSGPTARDAEAAFGRPMTAGARTA